MFRNKIKEIRETKGLSQTRLARMVEVAESSLCQVEHGQRAAWPKLRRMLSEKLGVPEAELFAED
jgi:transcriptional regulator with XRE-family HTH domain